MNQSTFPSVPRIESLHHRLKAAKGPDGEPLALLDELMVLLEDPPPEAGDRWQAGADFCAAHGIETSRPAVWRFYRVHVVQWRYENAPSFGKVTEKESAKLAEQARHLLTLRAIESLHQPNLQPGVLVGLVHNENRRMELQLARDKFDEQLRLKHQEEKISMRRAIDKAAEENAWEKYWSKAEGQELLRAAGQCRAGKTEVDLEPVAAVTSGTEA